jgi:hypothetical protein
MTVFEKIEAQQSKFKEGSPQWCVGEQLKEICRNEPHSAELVDKDLENEEMSIGKAEKKIKAWADRHKTGNFSFVSPQKAEEIIREFYGLPGREAAQEQNKQPAAVIDLGDFL